MLGVCYYPEHWPEDMWVDDAREMRELGLTYVRLGEFCWSRIEPQPGDLTFDWLDRAIDTLAGEGLKIVFGTPTATPPKWLIDRYPEILPVDPGTGRTRGFGSRRHYDFSSDIYQREALRICQALLERYGDHPAIVGWQTDNELSCHDTTLSDSDAALEGFRAWCQERYGDIEALNTAWGNVFWSMEYRSFDEIPSPFGAVTETNPAHRLAFFRYSSDRVIEFHDRMVALIREHAPGRWVTHNFIPKEDIYADPYRLGAPLDFASYDNYPLGRSDMKFAKHSAEEFRPFMRTGHPDLTTQLHDTTRSFSAGDFWVMEQQPGPVNWAPHNPKPAPGMVRLWSLEAFAHGAACVSYFRWRQVPFAQEQMHAAIKRRDNSRADAWDEVCAVRDALEKIDLAAHPKGKAAVAIVTDMEALWFTDIQRQGRGYDYRAVEFDYYSALCQLGVDVDFVPASATFDDYSLVVVPCLPVIDDGFVARCQASGARFLFGPRTGSKTAEFSLPDNLAPGALQKLIPVQVLSVETLRPDCPEPFSFGRQQYQSHSWREQLAGDADILAQTAAGEPVLAASGDYFYLGCLTETDFLKDLFRQLCGELGIETLDLPPAMRVARRGDLVFAFNYSGEPQTAPAGSEFLIGGTEVEPYGVSVWTAGTDEGA